MPQNRKFQNFVENKYMADDAIGAAELVDDSIGNAALAAGALKHQKITYNFSSGGAQGSITVGSLPDNAIVMGATLEVTTPITSGGSATVAFGITSNTDAFKAATAVGSLTGDAVFDSSNDLPLKMSGATNVLATVATADVDDGAFALYVRYYEGA